MLTQREIKELNIIRAQSLETAERATRLIEAGAVTPAPLKRAESNAVAMRRAKIFKNKKAALRQQ